jgi:exopolysaccharide biosynthesis polyprenyl glycosylphosphotransferase
MSAIDMSADALVGFDSPVDVLPLPSPRAMPSRPTLALVPRAQPALERRRLWERRYANRLRLTDTLVVLGVVAATAAVTTIGAGASAAAWFVSAGTALIWLTMLSLGSTRANAIMGSGATEYKRVAHSSGYAFGVLAILFLLFQWQQLRFELLLALPAGTVALLVGRWVWRKWLLKQRRFGHYSKRALVTGTRDDIEYVLRTLDEGGALGYTIVGTAPSDGRPDDVTANGRAYTVVGAMDSVALHARSLEADTIIVANRPEDDPDFIKRLSWELEGTASELIISSRVADVAGPRISLQPVDGLPLIQVKIPEFEGGRHALKRAVDIAVAAIALVPIGLVMPFVALAIWFDDRGPVFFRQTRIGRDGQEFSILKFRTMRIDAEQQLAKLEALNEGNGVLFKLKKDPRVTRVGAILRKYSIDELPQFWNVLRGDMSVVGPRPPLPKEVREYDGKVYRRLFIKPGITGLWQISGRSDLSWEESVRLDLRYVENWSVMSDLMIMWRTAKVMVSPTGAY